MSEIYLLMTITKRAMGRRLLSCYEHNGLSAVLCTLARGTATSEILDCLGLEMTEKTVMMAVITDETWKNVKRDMEESLQIDVPGTGIAFLVPVSSIGGGKLFRFLLDGQMYEREEENVMKNTKYELIVVIANHGYSEEVMEAARAQAPEAGRSFMQKGPGWKRQRSSLACLSRMRKR